MQIKLNARVTQLELAANKIFVHMTYSDVYKPIVLKLNLDDEKPEINQEVEICLNFR